MAEETVTVEEMEMVAETAEILVVAQPEQVAMERMWRNLCSTIILTTWEVLLTSQMLMVKYPSI